MDIATQIENFFKTTGFGVVGASNNRDKYGNKVLRAYVANHQKAYPINPSEKLIEGIPALNDVFALPEGVVSISIITPPPVTEKIVEQAIQKGIKNIWMQPGAESAAAVENCEKHGINIISGGPCILVEFKLRPR